MLSISTKTGDQGKSSISTGKRLHKDELIFEVLGTQDELNAWLGLSLSKLSNYFEIQKKFLVEVQDCLFKIGAQLAGSHKVKLSLDNLAKLERKSHSLQETMGQNWTQKFLFPGGDEAAATIDVARTVCRRLERAIVKFSRHSPTPPLILQYINRLSDYLFVLRCFVNFQEKYQEKKFEI